MRPLLIITFGLIAVSAFAQHQPFDEQVETIMEELLDQMEVESDALPRLYIQPPVYLDGEAKQSTRQFIGGPFARYLRAACESSIRSPFSLIPRDELDGIWAEVNLAQVATSHDPDAVLQSLQSLVTEQVTLPLDAIVIAEYGQWFGNPQQIRLNLYLIDVPHVQKYTKAATLHLTRAQAEDAPARPDNYEAILQRTQQLSHIVHAEAEAIAASDEEDFVVTGETFFKVSVIVDKGHGAVYLDGEALTLHVSSEIDCYIAVVNIDTAGEVHMLFPNTHETDNFLRAGAGRQLPAPEQLSNYDFGISAPFGVESIKVFASQTPFPVDSVLQTAKSVGGTFPHLGTNAADGVKTIRHWTKAVIQRDKQNARLAEAQCFFTTMPQSGKGIW